MKSKLLVDPYEWIDQLDIDCVLVGLQSKISMKIFDERIARGMKQKEFAEYLDVSQSMISKLESGEYNPTVEQLYKIATKLDLKLRIDLDEI